MQALQLIIRPLEYRRHYLREMRRFLLQSYSTCQREEKRVHIGANEAVEGPLSGVTLATRPELAGEALREEMRPFTARHYVD
jgi:histone acetyltransferase (RNA polymerase elongator complex component)